MVRSSEPNVEGAAMADYEEKSSHATREDVESLAEKLDAFAASLNDGERALLSRVIATAALATDTSEAEFSGPLAANLARGANFAEGELAVPKVPVINPGKLRAKDEELFQSLSR
jgi:hypothetical protein